jgi:hypothetical protein
MGIEHKIVDYLRSKEVTEPELIGIYKNFGEKVYNEGFNEGCEYVRSILQRQRASKKQNLRNKYSEFLTQLDDHLHAVQ